MTTIIDAVYEGGFFRPTSKIALTEGTRVEVLIPQAPLPRDPKAVAAKLSQIAAKAPRRHEPDSTSQNHDQILYGGR